MNSRRTMLLGTDFLICRTYLEDGQIEDFPKFRTSYAFSEAIDKKVNTLKVEANGKLEVGSCNELQDTKEYYNQRVVMQNKTGSDILYKSFSTYFEKDIPKSGKLINVSDTKTIKNSSKSEQIIICYSGEFKCKTKDNEFRFHQLKAIRLLPGSEIILKAIESGIIGIFEKYE